MEKWVNKIHVLPLWASVAVTVLLVGYLIVTGGQQAHGQLPGWPGGIGEQHVYVPDQISKAVEHGAQYMRRDWENCLRCLKLAVGGEASNLSGHKSFDTPLPPVPSNFSGTQFEFVMPFPSGATLKVFMVQHPVYRTEWRPRHPTKPDGLPYRVLTSNGEIECGHGLAAIYVAAKNGG